MLRRRTSTDPPDTGDRGSAALEFILVGVLLLVPIVYLILALGAIQEQTLGTESGARHIARVLAEAPDATVAREHADAVLRSIVGEYGLDRDRVELAVACLPAGGPCPRAGATLVVTVRTRVALPLVPPVLGLDGTASVPVEASSAQRVSRLWGTP
jgi:hypothetical protein